jgi:general secretion pathway protein G
MLYPAELRGHVSATITRRGPPEEGSGYTIFMSVLLATLILLQEKNPDDVSKARATKVTIQQVAQALDLFKLDFDRYPGKLQDLVRRPDWVPENKWPPGGYVTKLPKDGWNRDLLYRLPGTNHPYDVISLGKDGKEGGEGVDADLWNHDAHKKR